MTAAPSASGHRPGRPPPDGHATVYRPDPSTPLRCCACGAAWTDDDEGRHAHRVVFGHQPKPREPSETAPAPEGDTP